MSSEHGKKHYFGGWKLTAVIAALVIIFFFVLMNPFNIGAEFPDDDMRIAVLLPLSGDYEQVGKIYLAGIETAQKELEKQGISYKLVLYDTKGDATEASRAVTDVYNSGIPVAIGPVMSDETISAATYAEVEGIVLISPGATSQLLESYNNYTYKLQSTDRHLAHGFANQLSEKYLSAVSSSVSAQNLMGIRDIAVIYDSSLSELTLFTSYLEEIEEAKEESAIVRQQNITTFPLTDTDAAAEYLLDEDPDCVILFVSTPDDVAELMKKTDNGEFNPYWFGGETLLLTDIPSPEEHAGKVAALTSVVCLTDPLFSFDAAEYGELPARSTAQYGYDALMAVNNAIQMNGYSVEAIKWGLDNLRMVGLSGVISFDETKTRYPSYDILIWRGGDTGWQIM